MDELVGQLATGAVYHRDAKPVDVAVARNLERRDGRLRQRVVRRPGRELQGREIDHQRTAPRIGEDASPGGVWRTRRAPIARPECEQQGDRQQAMSRHGGGGEKGPPDRRQPTPPHPPPPRGRAPAATTTAGPPPPN